MEKAIKDQRGGEKKKAGRRQVRRQGILLGTELALNKFREPASGCSTLGDTKEMCPGPEDNSSWIQPTRMCLSAKVMSNYFKSL